MTDRLQVTGDDGRVWEWESNGDELRCSGDGLVTGHRSDGEVSALLSEVVKLRAELDLALQALAAGGREFLLGTVESVKGTSDE